MKDIEIRTPTGEIDVKATIEARQRLVALRPDPILVDSLKERGDGLYEAEILQAPPITCHYKCLELPPCGICKEEKHSHHNIYVSPPPK